MFDTEQRCFVRPWSLEKDVYKDPSAIVAANQHEPYHVHTHPITNANDENVTPDLCVA